MAAALDSLDLGGRVHLFWDIENCPPEECPADALYDTLLAALRRLHTDVAARARDAIAFDAVMSFNSRYERSAQFVTHAHRRALHERGVTVLETHVARAGAADEVILQRLRELEQQLKMQRQHAPVADAQHAPMVVLVSGDGDYAPALNRLRQGYYPPLCRVTVVLRANSRADLRNAANYVLRWEDILTECRGRRTVVLPALMPQAPRHQRAQAAKSEQEVLLNDCEADYLIRNGDQQLLHQMEASMARHNPSLAGIRLVLSRRHNTLLVTGPEKDLSVASDVLRGLVLPELLVCDHVGSTGDITQATFAAVRAFAQANRIHVGLGQGLAPRHLFIACRRPEHLITLAEFVLRN